MKTTLLCPTRGRAHRMRELAASIDRTASVRPNIIFYIDEDDFASKRTADMLHTTRGGTVRGVVEPRGTRPMSDWWNACAERVTDGVVVFVDDEAMFRTLGWDLALSDALAEWPDRAVLLQPNDTIHGDACAGYFAVHWPTWWAVFGRLTPRQFTYGYADVWCMEVAQAAGRKVYLDHVVVENLAPKLQPPDRTHEENAERAERDRPGDLYHATQAEREEDVRKLRHYIDEFQDEEEFSHAP